MATWTAPLQPRRIPIIVATAALRPFAPIWRASAPVMAEVTAAAFFISGLMVARAGSAAPLLVLAAVVIGVWMRRAEAEAWALFIPGGAAARVRMAFGSRAGTAASAAALIERVLFVSLLAMATGQYAISLAVRVLDRTRFAGRLAAEDLVMSTAVVSLGVLWTRARQGKPSSDRAAAPWVMSSIAAVTVITIVGVILLFARHQPGVVPADVTRDLPAWSDWLVNGVRLPLAALAGLGLALPAIGTAEQLGRAASNLPQPRVKALARTLLAAGGIALVAVAGGTAVFAWLVPAVAQPIWTEVPLVGIVRHVDLPAVPRELITLILVAAAVFVMGFAAECGLTDTVGHLRRLIDQGLLSDAMGEAHPRFGTPARLIDTAVGAAAVVVLVSGGRLDWIASAYAMVLAVSSVLRLAALVRLRRGRPAAVGLHTPGIPVLCAVFTVSAVTLLVVEPAAWSGAGALAVLSFTLLAARPASGASTDAGSETFQLLPSTELSLDQVDVRPGGVLVAVRHPHMLGHLVEALRAAGDRDVAVMTARVLGIDPDQDSQGCIVPTDAERLLFAEVVAVAERQARAVRLLIVPAHDVADALVSAVIRLKSSEIFVGESATLATSTQARLLGEAWERADKPDTLSARLVVHHHSTGRSDIYFLGAHAPRLTPQDIDLVHRLWLDVTKVVGPHVHHHDLVRAALVHMSNTLKSPEREEALDLVRKLARPADELAAVVRQRDFPKLRDMLRNLPPSDVAEILAELSVEDQAVVFRLLPRADAADAFEYLSPEAQASLIKGMAHEDVASLLNEMDPDDRTTFLEELPATVTRQLLALLTPEERTVAIKLLGYPEGSIGRLMTPSYVAVREDWTLQQVLDHVRAHGQDSETLNIIYVVDDRGVLVDDIRIREFLLNPPDKLVSSLMDRRFIALKATDSEDVAVGIFRQHDRVALPVTDTAGVLIGIVTIDDVLVVAEEKATKEIQRIGGSEALDEPYMTIPFLRMIKKRAGWLTALFLGEMLTATAMSVYQDELSKFILLAAFIPLTISSGGNSGSQASTLIIRAMALGEVKLGDWFRIMRKELAAGLMLGSILGAVGFARITVTAQVFPGVYVVAGHPSAWFQLALTVGFALIGIVTWGSLVGSLLPLLLRRLGFDPATSSAPFVATLVDVTGLIIYFSVASVILRGALL